MWRALAERNCKLPRTVKLEDRLCDFELSRESAMDVAFRSTAISASREASARPFTGFRCHKLQVGNVQFQGHHFVRKRTVLYCRYTPVYEYSITFGGKARTAARPGCGDRAIDRTNQSLTTAQLIVSIFT
ncbi:hypothetical protein J6590_057550 [Homalodisca vitripennis]|nr:hypothetical protein J6590_057550 [Homalodisca vitripennis]